MKVIEDKKLTNYIGLANLINGGIQPKFIYLILNVNSNYKVKYKWSEYSKCYLIDNSSDENEDYDFYLRDCLLDTENFERCIELIEEEKKIELPEKFEIPKIEHKDNQRILSAEIKINGLIDYLKYKEEEKEK
jgi:hypothetical protein